MPDNPQTAVQPPTNVNTHTQSRNQQLTNVNTHAQSRSQQPSTANAQSRNLQPMNADAQDLDQQLMTTRQALVIIDNATSGYQSMNKQRTATLRNINLTIYEGDRIALVGNNGAGKSTLLRLIAGIRKPWSGSVNVCGNDTRSTTPEQLSDAVSFIFQNQIGRAHV